MLLGIKEEAIKASFLLWTKAERSSAEARTVGV